jgi:hypothetical protein
VATSGLRKGRSAMSPHLTARGRRSRGGAVEFGHERCGLAGRRAGRSGTRGSCGWHRDGRGVAGVDRGPTPSRVGVRRAVSIRGRRASPVPSARGTTRGGRSRPVQRAGTATRQLPTRRRVREVADRRRIEAFLAALAREATTATDVFLVGGTTGVVTGLGAGRAYRIDRELGAGGMATVYDPEQEFFAVGEAALYQWEAA